jgi:uncharacterized membrane protein
MKSRAWIFICVLTIAYAVYWSWFSIARHHTTNSTRFDLGNAEQVIWNTAHGRMFQSTDPYGTSQVSRLAYHADFWLLALVPIYAAAPYTETLLILQSLALASAILAVWLLARFWLKSDGWATVLAVVFALTPGLHWMNAFDFHAVAFATPLILWCMYAAVRQRYGWMLVLAIFAMLTKEEIGFVLLPVSAYLFFRAKRPTWGTLMLAPAIWSALMMFLVIPAAQQNRIQPNDVFRSPFGNSTSEVLVNLIGHPRQAWDVATSPNAIHYGLQLLVPFGFLPLGHWFVLGTLPDGLINLISGKDTQQTIFFHYQASLLPWLILATIGLLAWIRRRWPQTHWTPAVAGWLIVWAGVGSWLYGPLPGAQLDYSRVVKWHNPYAVPIREWSHRIPSKAAVTVTNNVGAHFARRVELYSFPLGVAQADYAVVLEGHQLPEVATQAEVSIAVKKLSDDVRWETLYQQGDLTILRKKE